MKSRLRLPWSPSTVRHQAGRGRAISGVANPAAAGGSVDSPIDDAVYRAFIERSGDAFFVHDVDGWIVAVNDMACSSTGYRRGQLLGMNVLDIAQNIPADDARRNWNDAMAGHCLLVPTVHRRSDGTTFPVETAMTCQVIDGCPHILMLSRDITDRFAADPAKHEATGQRVTESGSSSDPVANLLQAVIETAPDLVYVKDRSGRYQYLNTAVAELMGVSTDFAIGRLDSDLFPADLAEQLIATDRGIMETGVGREVEEYPIVDGERRTYLSNKAPYRGVDGTVAGLIGISRDVTASRRDQALLRHAEARWQFAIDGAGDGIWDWDVTSGEVFYSQQWKAMLGYSAEDVGTTLADWAERVHPDDYQHCWDIISAVLRGETAEFSLEHRMRTKDGAWRWIFDRGRAIEHGPDGLPTRLIGTHTDVTDRRRAEEEIRELNRQLRWRADHDDLTDLLGRAGFIERATRVVAERRADGHALAVLWIDLDSFKRINDALGHKIGDEVLQIVAKRLVDVSLPTDLVARLGGDEFVVLRPRVEVECAATDWAKRVLSVMAEPVEVDGLRLAVTCSIGLVESGATDDGITQLLIDGDFALLEAKREGRNRIVPHTASLPAPQHHRVALATHVRTMIERGEVIVRYQPAVNLATGEAVGAEALARILGPTGDEMSPADFVPHLEALGMLPDLTRLVLRRACADFATAPELGWVSVNLTSEDLADPQLPDLVERTLEETGLNSARLILELNERVVPERHVLDATRRLIERGARIALDDFGTGWSSLAQLRDLDLALVKIDRSVVSASTSHDGQQLEAMLTAAIAMAQALGLDVIAEGIEDPAESVALAAAGAQYAQGFLWSRPVSIDTLLAASRRSTDPM